MLPVPGSIVLTMIVKNEAHVIERCLASVRDLVSSWVVVDTGSTDGTQDVVRRAMSGIPGEVFDRPWRGFGASRTEAFQLAREQGLGEYALVIDADDEFVYNGILRKGLLPRSLSHQLHDHRDVYSMEIHLGDLRYRRSQLFRLAKPWSYVGVVHELSHCPEPVTRGALEGVVYQCHRDGARSQDPDKYRRDASLLEQAMIDESKNARYVFYAAQCWRDAGNDYRARALYERRVKMGGSGEEVFIALLETAKAKQRLGDAPESVIESYLIASRARPTRAEPLYELARYCRLRKAFVEGWIYAEAAAKIPFPTGDTLFVPSSVYAWRALDELAQAAYWTGRYEVSRATSEQILGEALFPEDQRERLIDNLAWAERALAKSTEDVTGPEDIDWSKAKEIRS